MGIKERTAALNKRRQAVAIIKNIRHARNLLAKHPLDTKLFNVINGKDGGIESIVGRPIVFDMLTDSEVESLRKELKAKMEKSETQALEQLRSSTIDFFKDIKNAIERGAVEVTSRDLHFITRSAPVALEAFKSTMNSIGGLDCERAMSAIEHFKVVAEEINENVPEFETEIDSDDQEEDEQKDEYEEELHTCDNPSTGELPPDPPNEDQQPVDDPAIPVELTEEEPTETPAARMLPDGTPDPDSADGDSPCTAQLSWTKAQENYFVAASKFISTEAFTMNARGYTAPKALDILKAYTDTITNYRNALVRLYNVVEPEESTLFDLMRGSTATYKRFNRVMVIVDKFEELRTALDKSCECLVAASKNMMTAATTA